MNNLSSTSLLSSREKTDQNLETERSNADETTTQSRIANDSHRGNELEASSYSRLVIERQRADDAMDLERSRVDSSMDRERLLNTGLVAALTTRDEFLAIVGHDLRNPIGAVSSCAGMLLEDFSEKLAPEVKTWIQFMKRNADRSLRLISDLQDVERIAQGQLTIETKSNDMGDIVREVVESYVHTASAKTILLRAMPSDFTAKVLCDRDRLIQVLANLIGNALKFTPEGGVVLVRSTLLAEGVQVSVVDSGPGIALDKQNHIFDRFAQIRSRDRVGLGLGLYISKMLIESQNGQLWVESEIGSGSTFKFVIPLANLG